jgi:hypothetical protein
LGEGRLTARREQVPTMVLRARLEARP